MQLIEKDQKVTEPDIAQIRHTIEADLLALDQLILSELTSQVPLINQITLHIIKSGGKRLRPLVVLLMAKALNYHDDNEHTELAAIIEFIHTATLLHDDVVDASELRRNQPTANALWGNEASVLSGDFLYSRAFQILARRNNIPVMKVIADTTNLIAEGEVMQLMNVGNHELSEKDYFVVIERKTATLYSAASEIGAIIATDNQEQQKAAADYGLHLGLAFQMIDDLLDYTADSNVSGKNLGDDLNEGKITLPLIYTIHNGTDAQKNIIQTAIKNKSRESIDDVITAITDSHGYEYTFNYAKKEAQKAKNCLQHLPENKYRDALAKICDFVLQREY